MPDLRALRKANNKTKLFALARRKVQGGVNGY
jgi:hypothetical protein